MAKDYIIVKVKILELEQSTVIMVKKEETLNEVLEKLHRKWQIPGSVDLYIFAKQASEGSSLSLKDLSKPLLMSKTAVENSIADSEELIVKKKTSTTPEPQPETNWGSPSGSPLAHKKSMKGRLRRRKKFHTQNKIFERHIKTFIEPNGYPDFFEQGLQYLEKNAMEIEGLFRLSGETKTITLYKTQIDKGSFNGFEDEYLAHNVTGLLKLFLRQLPEPLVPFHLYSAFMAASKLNTSDMIECLNFLVSKLESNSFRLLKRLCFFMNALAENSKVTKMANSNLGLVLGPNLMKNEGETMMDMVRDTSAVCMLTTMLFQHCDTIFEQRSGDDPVYLKICKVDYDYTSEDANEITIKKNDYLLCTDDSENNGWWEGQLDCSRGLFPMDYVIVHLNLDFEKEIVLDCDMDSGSEAETKLTANKANSKEKHVSIGGTSAISNSHPSNNNLSNLKLRHSTTSLSTLAKEDSKEKMEKNLLEQQMLSLQEKLRELSQENANLQQTAEELTYRVDSLEEDLDFEKKAKDNYINQVRSFLEENETLSQSVIQEREEKKKFQDMAYQSLTKLSLATSQIEDLTLEVETLRKR